MIESMAPPNIEDERSQIPGPELEEEKDQDGRNSKGEALGESSTDSLLFSMREELLQVAVKFLSHPSVRSSPVSSKRSFLEKKGLTNDEINEAFRRVPDLPPSGIIEQSPNLNKDVQLKPKAMGQSSQPLSSTSTGFSPSMLQVPSPSRFPWSRAFFALALLIASGAGTAILVKNFFLHRLKGWIRKVVLEEDDNSEGNLKRSLFQEVTEAAKEAASAAVNAAKASLEISNSKKEDRRYFEAFIRRLDFQVAELKSMSDAVWKLNARKTALLLHKQPVKYTYHASQNGVTSKSIIVQDDPARSFSNLMIDKQNGISSFDGSVGPSSAPASLGPYAGRHPKSYVEILAMIQRGEKPPGIKDIDDSPPNPTQPLPEPCSIPRLKPWEVAQPQTKSTYVVDQMSTSQLNGGQNVLPWWRSNSVRINGLHPESGTRSISYGAEGSIQQP